MSERLLDRIHQPNDVKQLSAQEVEQLCGEIRQFLLDHIAKTGIQSGRSRTDSSAAPCFPDTPGPDRF